MCETFHISFHNNINSNMAASSVVGLLDYQLR